MNAERYNRIEQIAQDAVELPDHKRAAYLDSACGGDAELRHEVESVIEYQEKAGSFLEAPALAAAAESLEIYEAESVVGRRFGHYTVLDLLGAGGMGTVYLAQDTNLGRKVALKLLPAYFTEDRDRLRRFAQEARSASALNHPNILTIHEVGRWTADTSSPRSSLTARHCARHSVAPAA